jgi:hypothetical protein
MYFMPRPLETTFLFNRVRLEYIVPLSDLEKFIEKNIHRYHSVLNITISAVYFSYEYFSYDNNFLANLLKNLLSKDYEITFKIQALLYRQLNDIYNDSEKFENFERKINPLLEFSTELKNLTELADSEAQTAKAYSEDIGKIIGVKVPSFFEISK